MLAHLQNEIERSRVQVAGTASFFVIRVIDRAKGLADIRAHVVQCRSMYYIEHLSIEVRNAVKLDDRELGAVGDRG